MALEAGTRFGSYEVVEPIGAGGMGEVWLARDTALNRDVAVKVLPQAFVEDADRLARFQREAEILASLNHANIATIYGLEKIDDQTVIVMELIEGPTLAEKITEGPIPVDETMGIALQIVSALEAAHDKQIVHRDLKPANVKVREDGTVKVLDFGISKPIDPTAISGSPVMTTPAVTQTGVILGTAAYMSPEQARGRFVDQRADIWAFGCLLFEMLTGQPAFAGEDVMAILARVIDRDTDLNSMPGTISPAVRHTIKFCLEKDPKERIADIRDVRLALGGRFDSGPAQPRTGDAQPSSRQRIVVPIGLAALASAVTAVAAWLLLVPDPEPELINRFELDIPWSIVPPITFTPMLATAPDGRQFVINSAEGIMLRRMDALEATVIVGPEEGATYPVFSPDGQDLAYYSADDRALKRIAIGASAPVPIISGIDEPSGASWEADGSILIVQTEGIVRIREGQDELVVPRRDGEAMYGPQLLPDGESVLFSAGRGTAWDAADIVVASLATDERTIILEGGSDARYLPSGHLLYAYQDTLYAAPFDIAGRRTTGPAESLESGLIRNIFTPAANYAVTADGTLIYLARETEGNVAARGIGMNTLVWRDRAGNETPVGAPSCVCLEVAVSPDGSRVALVRQAAFDDYDIWVWSFGASTFSPVTSEPDYQLFLLWSPDGQSITFQNGQEGIYSRAASGAGNSIPVFENPYRPSLLFPFDYDDEDNILFTMGQTDIHVLSAGANTGDEPLLANTDYAEFRPALSPNGRWLAYESDRSGAFEIYVVPYPDVESNRQQVSTGGGTDARWSADGTSLYFIGPTHLMETAVRTESDFEHDPPVALFEYQSNNYRTGPQHNYAVSDAGDRFLLLKQDPETIAPPTYKIRIVQNWTNELERLVPTD